jgi:hypothetical protein
VSSVLSQPDAEDAERPRGGQRDRVALLAPEHRVRSASADRWVIALLRSHTVFKRAVHAPSDRKSAVRNWDLRQRGGGGSDMGDSPSAPNYALAPAQHANAARHRNVGNAAAAGPFRDRRLRPGDCRPA